MDEDTDTLFLRNVKLLESQILSHYVSEYKIETEDDLQDSNIELYYSYIRACSKLSIDIDGINMVPKEFEINEEWFGSLPYILCNDISKMLRYLRICWDNIVFLPLVRANAVRFNACSVISRNREKDDLYIENRPYETIGREGHSMRQLSNNPTRLYKYINELRIILEHCLRNQLEYPPVIFQNQLILYDLFGSRYITNLSFDDADAIGLLSHNLYENENSISASEIATKDFRIHVDSNGNEYMTSDVCDVSYKATEKIERINSIEKQTRNCTLTDEEYDILQADLYYIDRDWCYNFRNRTLNSNIRFFKNLYRLDLRSNTYIVSDIDNAIIEIPLIYLGFSLVSDNIENVMSINYEQYSRIDQIYFATFRDEPVVVDEMGIDFPMFNDRPKRIFIDEDLYDLFDMTEFMNRYTVERRLEDGIYIVKQL
jgi:hypothetical protein